MDERIVFYREWLPLDKKEFRILAMLADQGEFCGNLSDLCNYFSLSPQQRNRNTLRTSIEQLAASGFITYTTKGRSYHIKVIPKAKEIRLCREWLRRLISHDYSSENVAWEQVLKVLLWILDSHKRFTMPLVLRLMSDFLDFKGILTQFPHCAYETRDTMCFLVFFDFCNQFFIRCIEL